MVIWLMRGHSDSLSSEFGMARGHPFYKEWPGEFASPANLPAVIYLGSEDWNTDGPVGATPPVI